MSEFSQSDAPPSTVAPSTVAPSTVAPSTVAPSTVAPSIADDLEKALDPKSVTAARMVIAVLMMILAIPLAATGIIIAFGDLESSTFIGLGVGVLLYAALFAWGLYWPGVRYRYAWYRVAKRGLWIRRGVVWRSEISVPRSRVQHTDVSQGPIDRRFGLATLVLHTAGTQHAAVSLGGLSHTAALAIRDYLIEDDAADAG